MTTAGVLRSQPVSLAARHAPGGGRGARAPRAAVPAARLRVVRMFRLSLTLPYAVAALVVALPPSEWERTTRLQGSGDGVSVTMLVVLHLLAGGACNAVSLCLWHREYGEWIRECNNVARHAEACVAAPLLAVAVACVDRQSRATDLVAAAVQAFGVTLHAFAQDVFNRPRAHEDRWQRTYPAHRTLPLAFGVVPLAGLSYLLVSLSLQGPRGSTTAAVLYILYLAAYCGISSLPALMTPSAYAYSDLAIATVQLLGQSTVAVQLRFR